MKRVIALDVDKREIKHGDLVEIVEKPVGDHRWLKVGNVMRVSYWEDRSFSETSPYICVFLSSKRGLNQCSIGVQDNRLKVVEE